MHTSANNFAFEHVESSKQRRCAVALIVMGHRAGPALLIRNASGGLTFDFRYSSIRPGSCFQLQTPG